MERDPSLDALLGLDGQVYMINAEAGFWVRFVVRQVPATEARPHGLAYTLTLHDGSNNRLVGFDNAHPVTGQAGPGGRARRGYDHKHRLKTVRPYEYRDAATLLEDFWKEVEAFCRENGVKL
jgi:hypothetical protein